MAAFTFASTQIRADWNYVSSLGAIGGINLHKPEVDEQLVKRYGSQLITDLMDTIGAKKAVSSLQYIHYEEDRIMPKILATCTTASSGATEAVFLLDSTSEINNPAQTLPYAGTSASGKRMPVRVNDTLLIKPLTGTVSASTMIQAFVTSVDQAAGTFNALPFDNSEPIGLNATNAEIVIYGNAFGEGSEQPDGRNSQVISYMNNLQIMKESFDVTGSEKDAVLWIKVQDPTTGKTGYAWYLKGESDTYKRALNYRESIMLLSKKLNNVNLSNANVGTDAGTPLKTTEGLIPFALGNGTISNYSAVNGWTIADAQTMIIEMDKQKASKQNTIWAGIQLSLNMDTELKANFQGGAMRFGDFNFNEDAKANFAFSTFKLGEYTFHKKTYDLFNDIQLLGADGFNFRNEGIVVPMDMNKDGKTGEKVPSLRMRFLEGPDGSNSREMRHEVLDQFKLTGKDAFKCQYISESGFEGFAGNRFAYIKQA